MLDRTPHSVLAVLGVLSLCAAVEAGNPTTLELIPVDQGIEDLDSLSTSLRVVYHDLRADNNFQRLYVDANDPGRYIRVGGGLYAVSQRTDYMATKSGWMASVSPGTVFYVGPPPPSELADEPERSRGVTSAVLPMLASRVQFAFPVEQRIDGRAHDSENAESTTRVAQSPRTTKPERLDMSDDAYRVRRLRQLAQDRARQLASG